MKNELTVAQRKIISSLEKASNIRSIKFKKVYTATFTVVVQCLQLNTANWRTTVLNNSLTSGSAWKSSIRGSAGHSKVCYSARHSLLLFNHSGVVVRWPIVVSLSAGCGFKPLCHLHFFFMRPCCCLSTCPLQPRSKLCSTIRLWWMQSRCGMIVFQLVDRGLNPTTEH